MNKIYQLEEFRFPSYEEHLQSIANCGVVKGYRPPLKESTFKEFCGEVVKGDLRKFGYNFLAIGGIIISGSLMLLSLKPKLLVLSILALGIVNGSAKLHH